MTRGLLDAAVCFAALLKPSNRAFLEYQSCAMLHQAVPVQTLVTVCHLSISKLDYALEEIQETSSIAQSVVLNNFCV